MNRLFLDAPLAEQTCDGALAALVGQKRCDAWAANLSADASAKHARKGLTLNQPGCRAEHPIVCTSQPRLFSYVLAYDTGFAPHVQDGICTLATCKPEIRRRARRGDWIVGTSGRRYCDSSFRLVYLMQVTEDPMAFDEYDHAYPERRPSSTNRFGDNIYFINGSGTCEQRPNERHRPESMKHDLSGRSVLVSNRFVYFGDALPEIPSDLNIVKKGPGHRSNFDPSVLKRLIDRTNELVGEHGWNKCHGRPNDESRL